MLSDSTIGFIGAGNMAGALIEGLLANGVAPARLWASDTDAGKLAALAAKGIRTSQANAELVAACDVLVLAVKPQVMAAVVGDLKAALAAKSCLLVSIAAGIQLASLQQWTSPQQAIVRCMPNTPALVLAGATGAVANARVSAGHKAIADALLRAVGIVCWLDDEEQIDAVTAVSGSGPAYFFLMIEAMQAAGTKLGLPADVARALTLQTAFGAAKLALNSDADAAELRRRVTSPNGTTEAAIRQFENDSFRDVVDRALGKAAARSRELAAGK
ncbi:MAG TPA: pyrroline-5-carboxylate reductase [Pseudomonadales bacterium]